MSLQVHGTYPFDGNKWRRVSRLKPLEAARRLGVAVTPAQKRLAKSEDLYLFLNKGFVVLGDAPPKPPSSTAVAFMEVLGGSDGSELPVGTRAIYLHDGRYSLIERIDPEAEVLRAIGRSA